MLDHDPTIAIQVQQNFLNRLLRMKQILLEITESYSDVIMAIDVPILEPIYIPYIDILPRLKS